MYKTDRFSRCHSSVSNMKYALVLCLLSACLLKLTTGSTAECDQCTATYEALIQPRNQTLSVLCAANRDYANCLESKCEASQSTSALIDELRQPLKAAYCGGSVSVSGSGSGSGSDLYSGSVALSTSLLEVVGSLLLSAYQTFYL